jgi:hypothetical protein
MIHLATYKLIHIIGVFALFLAFGAMLASDKTRVRWATISHGLALLLIIVSGFGLMARLGIHSSLPGWVIGKLLLWVLFGISLSFIKRKLLPNILMIPFLLSLGGVAVYLALWKP